MAKEMADNDGSSWTKILIVRFEGVPVNAVKLGHGILHPKDDYELLIDRVKEVLKEKNIDSKRMRCVYDTKTKLKATKALWALEMHTTKDVTVQLLSETYIEWAVGIAIFLVFPAIGYTAYNEINIVLASFVVLFTYGIILVTVFPIFKRYEQRSQEAARAMLYPAN
jgi:hypothetical protein